jgi:hypothetical protein
MTDSVEQALNDEPLLGFSFYTASQVAIVNSLGSEIVNMLDESISENSGGEIRVERFTKMYGSFWLWVLGAFEVTRTMASAKPCFSPDAHGRVVAFKNRLIKLRVPFAKQQVAGRREATRGEASVSGFDGKKRDLLFVVEGAEYWVKDLIQEFASVIGSIKKEDVLMDYNHFLAQKHG